MAGWAVSRLRARALIGTDGDAAIDVVQADPRAVAFHDEMVPTFGAGHTAHVSGDAAAPVPSLQAGAGTCREAETNRPVHGTQGNGVGGAGAVEIGLHASV